jgi:hypothetical protein
MCFFNLKFIIYKITMFFLIGLIVIEMILTVSESYKNVSYIVKVTRNEFFVILITKS